MADRNPIKVKLPNADGGSTTHELAACVDHEGVRAEMQRRCEAEKDLFETAHKNGYMQSLYQFGFVEDNKPVQLVSPFDDVPLGAKRRSVMEEMQQIKESGEDAFLLYHVEDPVPDCPKFEVVQASAFEVYTPGKAETLNNIFAGKERGKGQVLTSADGALWKALNKVKKAYDDNNRSSLLGPVQADMNQYGILPCSLLQGNDPEAGYRTEENCPPARSRVEIYLEETKSYETATILEHAVMFSRVKFDNPNILPIGFFCLFQKKFNRLPDAVDLTGNQDAKGPDGQKGGGAPDADGSDAQADGGAAADQNGATLNQNGSNNNASRGQVRGGAAALADSAPKEGQDRTATGAGSIQPAASVGRAGSLQDGYNEETSAGLGDSLTARDPTNRQGKDRTGTSGPSSQAAVSARNDTRRGTSVTSTSTTTPAPTNQQVPNNGQGSVANGKTLKHAASASRESLARNQTHGGTGATTTANEANKAHELSQNHQKDPPINHKRGGMGTALISPAPTNKVSGTHTGRRFPAASQSGDASNTPSTESTATGNNQASKASGAVVKKEPLSTRTPKKSRKMSGSPEYSKLKVGMMELKAIFADGKSYKARIVSIDDRSKPIVYTLKLPGIGHEMETSDRSRIRCKGGRTGRVSVECVLVGAADDRLPIGDDVYWKQEGGGKYGRITTVYYYDDKKGTIKYGVAGESDNSIQILPRVLLHSKTNKEGPFGDSDHAAESSRTVTLRSSNKRKSSEMAMPDETHSAPGNKRACLRKK